MAKSFNEPTGRNTGVSQSISRSISSGWSEGLASSETVVEQHEPVVTSGAKALLLWNLGDLRNNLHRAEDLTASDRDWYLAKARAIFDNALQKKEMALKEDRNDAE